MVSYDKLWKLMDKKGITTYTLIKEHQINPRTINHLKHNKGIHISTLEQLCTILKCTPNDILSFEDDTEE